MNKKEFHLVTLGEILIDMFPVEVGCRLHEVKAFLPTPGGAPVNVAVAAVRLGYKSAFIGKVGNEIFGKQLIEVLKSNSIDIRGVMVDPEARTTLAFIGMPDEHTYEIEFYRNPGADYLIRPDELDHSLLENTAVFHGGSLSLTNEPARSAHYEAVEIARSSGAMISFDVNYRSTLWQGLEEARQIVMEMVKKTDVLKINDRELELLTGSNDPKVAARQLLAYGPKLIAITLGQYGSWFCTDNALEFVPAYKVETVDSVGCGDAFIAALLCQMVTDGPWQNKLATDTLRQAFNFANAVGAVTALTRGVIPALPTRERVNDFLLQRKQKC